VAVSSVLWLFFQPGWEPLVVSLGSVGTLITFAVADEFKSANHTAIDRRESDKKQLAHLLETFPYDQSKEEALSSEHSGVTERFARSLDQVLTFRNSPYQLPDKKVESKRKEFLRAATEYYEALLRFVSWDEGHTRLVPPFHLKGGANESAYRTMQRDVYAKAKALIEHYDALIATAKDHNVYPA
jgi:hypothetical protein